MHNCACQSREKLGVFTVRGLVLATRTPSIHFHSSDNLFQNMLSVCVALNKSPCLMFAFVALSCHLSCSVSSRLSGEDIFDDSVHFSRHTFGLV